MPRRCLLCHHDERSAVDAALVAGGTHRAIGARYGVSRTSVARHEAHLPREMVKAQEEKEVRQALDVVDQLRTINGAALRILADAGRGNPDLALKAIDRVQKQIELQAKLLEMIDDRPVVHLHLSPEWITLRTRILIALEPFLEARLALVEAIGANGAGE